MKECRSCHRCLPDEYAHCPDDGSPVTSSIVGGVILDNRYLLEKRLGQGGMGIVYRARHVYLKTLHALKVILPELVGHDETLLARFRQEAMASAAIRHQNIVAVTDFGVASGTMPFLVMEFIKGRSLQDVLNAAGRLTPAHTLEITEAIGAGVGAAHRVGVIHRDLKPLNIMVGDDLSYQEGIKVLDFGLAKIRSTELLGSFIAARTQGMIGSPFYMSPEQWSDEEPDARADIYSLGVILFQMLAGDVPFRGNSVPVIMKKHLLENPPLEMLREANVPAELVAVVEASLQKDPANRPQTAEDFIQVLRRSVHGTYSMHTPSQGDYRITLTAEELESIRIGRTQDALRGRSGEFMSDSIRQQQAALKEAGAEQQRSLERERQQIAEEKQQAAEYRRQAEYERQRLAEEKRAAEEMRRAAEVEREGITAEKARLAAEAQARIEEERRRAQAEAERQTEETRQRIAREAQERIEAEKQRAAEEARRAAEKELQARLAVEKQRAEEAARKAAAEERQKVLAAQKAAEEERQRLAAEKQNLAEERRRIAEEKQQAKEEAERRTQMRAARRAAEEEERRIETEKRQAEEQERKAAIAEERRQIEAERAQALAEERQRVEAAVHAAEEARRAAEEAKQRAEEEARQRAAEAEAARRLAESEAARRQAEEAARLRAESEAREYEYKARHAEQASGERDYDRSDMPTLVEGSPRWQKSMADTLSEGTDSLQVSQAPSSLPPQPPSAEAYATQQIKKLPTGEMSGYETHRLDPNAAGKNLPPSAAQSGSFSTAGVNLAAGENAGQTSATGAASLGGMTSLMGSASMNGMAGERSSSVLKIGIAAGIGLILIGAVIGIVFLRGGSNEAVPTDNGKGYSQNNPPPQMAYLAGGSFQMGQGQTPCGDARDCPAHQETVKPLFMDKTEVTNAEYAEFLAANSGFQAPKNDAEKLPENLRGEQKFWRNWQGKTPPAGEERLPVRNVTTQDAGGFALWRSQKLKLTCRLPTEAEWEFAARGTNAKQSYPWGDKWDDGRAVIDAEKPLAVGSRPTGASPAGVQDLIGNVFEWTSANAAYFNGNAQSVGGEDKSLFVFRGGSYANVVKDDVSATYRFWSVLKFPTVGFRLVCEVPNAQ